MCAPSRRVGPGFSALIALSSLTLLVLPDAVQGQVRGQPVFFEPIYAYDGRAGIDAGHFGETDGSSVVASGSLHIWVGNCRRFSVSAAAGVLNPGGPAGTRFSGALGGQVLLNPCESPLSVSALTFRFITGLGHVRGEGESSWNVPIGVGAGWLLPFPVVRIEPWIVPHVVYREPVPLGDVLNASRDVPSGGSWNGALSAGFTFGIGEVAGLRVAGSCCKGGVGLGYGVSLWF